MITANGDVGVECRKAFVFVFAICNHERVIPNRMCFIIFHNIFDAGTGFEPAPAVVFMLPLYLTH
jgi:hypothetical protein